MFVDAEYVLGVSWSVAVLCLVVLSVCWVCAECVFCPFQSSAISVVFNLTARCLASKLADAMLQCNGISFNCTVAPLLLLQARCAAASRAAEAAAAERDLLERKVARLEKGKESELKGASLSIDIIKHLVLLKVSKPVNLQSCIVQSIAWGDCQSCAW